MKRKKDTSKKRSIVRFDDNSSARDLFGPEGSNLRILETELGIEIDCRGNTLLLIGPEKQVLTAEEVLGRLYAILRKGNHLIGGDVERAVRLIASDKNADVESLFSESVFLPTKRRPVLPRSPGQREYVEKIKNYDMVFSIGPAGTGKSYLAVAIAVSCLLKKQFERIILARPAVEAGEKLGFLPGDMLEKVNPYLRPLYDALYDMLDRERVQELIDDDIIEIAPLAFMRGRTLHRSFIIIDEAQNCSYQQMKMCLTRHGRCYTNGPS